MPRKNRTSLQSLPLELLSEIFVLSQNPRLPETCVAFKRMLSSRHLIYRFLASVVEETPLILGSGSRYRIEKPVLQQLVECSWFCPAFLDEWLMRTKRVDLCTKMHYASACPCTNSIELDYDGIELPLRALRSPWTPEQIELLVTMVAYGARISPNNFAAGQQALKAVYSALDDFKLEVLMSILIAGAVLRPFAADIVRYAVLETQFSRKMVLEVLAWVRPATIDYSDPQLVIWAKKQQLKPMGGYEKSIYLDNEPDDDGTWLLKTLRSEARLKTPSDVRRASRTPTSREELREILHQKCYRLRRASLEGLGEMDPYESVY